MIKKGKKTLLHLKYLLVLGQLFKPWEANPRSYATKNGSAYRPCHKEKNLTHCCSLREGNLAANEVLIEFQKVNTVYKVTWGSHLPICFWPLPKTFAKSHSVGPAIYVPAVSGFFSPYTKLNSKSKEVITFNFETKRDSVICCFVAKIFVAFRFLAALIVW